MSRSRSPTPLLRLLATAGLVAVLPTAVLAQVELLPPEILAKLNAAMVTTLADPAVIKKFADLTAETKSSTPQELAAMLDKEEKLVVPLIKKLGIKAE